MKRSRPYFATGTPALLCEVPLRRRDEGSPPVASLHKKAPTALVFFVGLSLGFHLALSLVAEVAPPTTPSAPDLITRAPSPATIQASPPQMAVVDLIQEDGEAEPPPPEPLFFSHQNHAAKQEVVVPVKRSTPRGTSPKASSSPAKRRDLADAAQPSTSPRLPAAAPRFREPQTPTAPQDARGALFQGSYDSLLQASLPPVPSLQAQGGGAFIESERAQLGGAISLSTKEFRYMSYFSKLREAILSTWDYPPRAQRSRLSGRVRVRFSIGAAGELTEVVVLTSSGFPILDRHVVQALRKAAPFAPLPAHFPSSPLSVSGVFVYVIE